MRYSLCALPLIGLPIGGMLLLWYWCCVHTEVGAVLFAAVAVALPILITGGIHLDGFCDTTDAISSRQEKERKLEILKDPHVGAFAVMNTCVFLLVCFGLFTELYPDASSIQVLSVGFAFSRSLAVLSAVTMPNAKGDGMLAILKNYLERRVALIITLGCLMLCTFGMIALHLITGLLCTLLCCLWLLVYRFMSMSHFGGVTGDTTGFFLQVTELFLLIGALMGRILERMV